MKDNSEVSVEVKLKKLEIIIWSYDTIYGRETMQPTTGELHTAAPPPPPILPPTLMHS